MEQVWGTSLSLRVFLSRPRARNQAIETTAERFERLVAADWDRFYRFAAHLCNGNLDEAEELLAESMADAFRTFDRFSGDGFARWFFRVLSHNRVDTVRRSRVRRARSLDELELAGEGRIAELQTAGPEAQLLAACYSEPVQRALEALTEEFRAVVLLCDVEGMDYRDAAQVLGVPIGTIRSRLARARERLRAKLGGETSEATHVGR